MKRTSLSHPLQIAEVEVAPGFGRIGVTFCPGKTDAKAMTGAWERDLTLDLERVAQWGAAAVVTLVEQHELELLQVPGLGKVVEARHMLWWHLPIPDVSTPGPTFERGWVTAGPALRAMLRDGASVLVHCRGGLGRAGMIAARLLIELRDDARKAISKVRKVRPGAIETAAQEKHLIALGRAAEADPDCSVEACRDRAVGAFLGLAVGDAIGTTLEFKPRDDSAQRLTDMAGGGPFRLDLGQWTDDTSMALALADSLHVHPHLEPSDLMERFVAWWKQGTYSCTGQCFDIGNTTRDALQRWLRTGDPLAGSAAAHTAGNGSLMRLAPAAIRHWNNAEARDAVAIFQSRTTHGAEEAIDACRLYADLIAEAIAGQPRYMILAPRAFKGSAKIEAIANGAWRTKPRIAIRGSGYVVDALEAALWCIGRTADFPSAVLMAANLRDDADTTAAITGQLAGALYGASGIPREWLDRLAWHPRIKGMAQGLFEASLTG